jgi:hypothetical protein
MSFRYALTVLAVLVACFSYAYLLVGLTAGVR